MRFAPSAVISCCVSLFVVAGSTLGQDQKAKSPPPKDGPEGTSIFDSLTFRDPAKKPPVKKTLEARGKRFALCIGVRQADINGNVQKPLPMCVNDAVRLGELLEKAGYTTMVMTDDATDANLKPTVVNAVNKISEICNSAGSDDQILIHVSTHGTHAFGKPQLAMQDGLLDLETIKFNASTSSALVRIIMLDCCRDEGTAFNTETKECRNVHVVLACRPDQESLGGLNGLSIFTEALIDGLTNCTADRYQDSRIELDEVLYYIEDHMPLLLERDFPGMDMKQNPTRTVVDPMAINPVLIACEKTRTDSEPAAPVSEKQDFSSVIAIYEPVRPSLQNDLIISSEMAGKVQIGMTPAQVQQAMTIEPSIGYEPDAKGDDVVLYENTPRAGDQFWVFFLTGKVARVVVIEADPCEGTFDRELACRGMRRLTDGHDEDEYNELFSGLSKPQVRALMGCPSAGASTDAHDAKSAVWTYECVPMKLLNTLIRFEGDHVVKVDTAVAKQ